MRRPPASLSLPAAPPALAYGVYTGIEASAAASGGAAGYMEILGNVGWRWAPAASVPIAFEARGGLGLGGGGAMPTDGGTIGKVAVGASVDWGRGWRTGIEVGGRHVAHQRPQRWHDGRYQPDAERMQRFQDHIDDPLRLIDVARIECLP